MGGDRPTASNAVYCYRTLHGLDVMPPKKPPFNLDVDCLNILPQKNASLDKLIDAILDSRVIDAVAKALGSVISGIVETHLDAKLLSFTKSFNIFNHKIFNVFCCYNRVDIYGERARG